MSSAASRLAGWCHEMPQVVLCVALHTGMPTLTDWTSFIRSHDQIKVSIIITGWVLLSDLVLVAG